MSNPNLKITLDIQKKDGIIVLIMTEIIPSGEIKIQQEHLEVANKYLEAHSISEVADTLNLPVHVVEAVINRPEVKRYIDSIFLECTALNRFKIINAFEEILETKLEEMKESGIGSNKDIVEILSQMHKISMDYRKLDAPTGPSVQKNVQINNYGENYNALTKALKRNAGSPT